MRQKLILVGNLNRSIVQEFILTFFFPKMLVIGMDIESHMISTNALGII